MNAYLRLAAAGLLRSPGRTLVRTLVLAAAVALLAAMLLFVGDSLSTMTATATLAFEQAREQISERVFTDKRKSEFQKYLDKLRAQAIIEWKNENVHKAFEQGLKAMASAS